MSLETAKEHGRYSEDFSMSDDVLPWVFGNKIYQVGSQTPTQAKDGEIYDVEFSDFQTCVEEGAYRFATTSNMGFVLDMKRLVDEGDLKY